MDDIQQKCLRCQSLRSKRREAVKLWAVILGAVLASAFAMAGQLHIPAQKPIEIPNVRSGRASLRQDARTTTFVFTAADGQVEQIVLTHPSKYPRGFNAPYAAKVLAEIPGKLLIFTDTFASNPGNVQGQCGASPTGERFLHVISLASPVRETFSLLIQSCLLDIEPKRGSPVFNLSTRTLTLNFETNNGHPLSETYHIDADNSVKQETVP